MKKLFFIIAVIALTAVRAQNPDGFIYLHYVTVDSKDAGAHIKAEKEFHAKFHAQKIKEGKKIGWDMWRLENADYGDNETTFLYVHLEKGTIDWSPVSVPGISEAEVAKEGAAFQARLKKHGMLVVKGKGGFGPQDAKGPLPVVVMNYMDVNPYRTAEYERVELEDFMPAHKASGNQKGWVLSKIVNRFGTEEMANYITSDFYPDLKTLYNVRAMSSEIPEEQIEAWEAMDELRTLKKSHIFTLVAFER